MINWDHLNSDLIPELRMIISDQQLCGAKCNLLYVLPFQMSKFLWISLKHKIQICGYELCVYLELL